MSELFPRDKYGEIDWNFHNGDWLTTPEERDGYRCRIEQDRKVRNARCEWARNRIAARLAERVSRFGPKARAWLEEYNKLHPQPYPDYWKHRNEEREAWAAMKEDRENDSTGR